MRNIKTKYTETCTLGDVMIFFRGNQTQAALHLNIARGSLKSYLDKGANQLCKVIRDGADIEGFELINKSVK